MATAKPAPAPAPKPAPTPQPSVAATAAQNIAAVKTKHDYLRPLRYINNFALGSTWAGLDEMANWGQWGTKLGLMAGIIVGIAAAPVGLGFAWAFGCTALGMAVGAAAGATHGVLTGGPHAVARQHRAEKYAEDLVVRKNIRSATPENHADYRKATHNKALAEDALRFRQNQAQLQEIRRDTNHYWRDHVDNRRQQEDLAPSNQHQGF